MMEAQRRRRHSELSEKINARRMSASSSRMSGSSRRSSTTSRTTSSKESELRMSSSSRRSTTSRDESKSSRTRQRESIGKEEEPTTMIEDSDPTCSGSSQFLVELPPAIEKKLPTLYKDAKLAPVDLKFDTVREESYTVNLNKAHKSAIQQQVLPKKAKASVLFVVKRPGCVLCHEQGDDLQKLVQEFPASSVAAFACIKEINVDNEGLLKLYQNYFRFPFYRDTDMQMYKALGDRRVGVLTALKRYTKARVRWESKGLRGNMIGKGEGMILGGVLVLNRRGEVQYVHQEKFGFELPIEEIRTAIKDVMNE